jgi:hypothetical protein
MKQRAWNRSEQRRRRRRREDALSFERLLLLPDRDEFLLAPSDFLRKYAFELGDVALDVEGCGLGHGVNEAETFALDLGSEVYRSR